MHVIKWQVIQTFLGEAIRTAVDLINLSPAAHLNYDIPERDWSGEVHPTSV